MTAPVEKGRTQAREAERFNMRRDLLIQIVALEGDFKNRKQISKGLSLEQRETLAEAFTLVATAENRKELMEIATEIDKLREENGTPNFPTFTTTFTRTYDRGIFAMEEKTKEKLQAFYNSLKPELFTQLARANFPNQRDVPELYCPPLAKRFRPEKPNSKIERSKFTKQYNYKIGNEITRLKETDPRGRKITDEVRADIILIVSKAINARSIDQILRLATVADRLNASRRGLHTTIEQRITNYFAAAAPTDLEEEKKTKQELPKIFINMQADVAEELGRALYNGDIDIASRYCRQITKNISSEIDDDKGRKIQIVRSPFL